jgi:HAD superfamily hydrolase (TIGR01459 family)
MQLLPGLSDIAGDYDAIISDVWGVIHNGKAPFPEACAALAEFRRTRGPVVLVTNAPVPKHRVTAVFDRVGVPKDCWDDVIASGDVTRHELARRAPGPVYRIGLSEDDPVYRDLALDFTDDPGTAAVVCCTGLRDYPDGHPETYRPELKSLAARGLTMICANPDVQFRYGDRLIWSAGALAAIHEEEGGNVLRTGKPDAAIYALARETLTALMGRAPGSRRILAIGDGPATDIRGANREGLDALFVVDGIHGAELAAGGDLVVDAQALMRREGAEARYLMPSLAW